MARSTKASWLEGPGDVKEAEVHDVPVPGESVLVRGLSAKYSAEVMTQMKLVQEGRSQVGRFDIGTMQVLQFVHGVIDPQFTVDEAKVIQEKYGTAFSKVLDKIQELSGLNQEAVEETNNLFRSDGTPENGTGGRAASEPVVDPVAAGDSRPDVPTRAGA